jgi:hypothetical protein
MVARTLRGSLGIRFTRPLAPPLLFLGLLAWFATQGLHAQVADQKKDGPPQPVPSLPAAVPQQPGPPAPQPALDALISVTATTPQALLQRFQFKIDPKTPLKDLLPAAPKVGKITGPAHGDDLTRVPEVRFEADFAKNMANTEAMRQIAHQIAKINHLNDKKTDGFLEALRDARLDLNGLPFAMGDACRTKGERSKQFAFAVATVRRALPRTLGQSSGPILSVDRVVFTTPGGSVPAPTVPPSPQPSPLVANPAPPTVEHLVTDEDFWDKYQTVCSQEDRAMSQKDRAQCDTVTVARIAALMQVLAPMSPTIHRGLVKYLSAVPHVEATKALARLAIFSAEDEVRGAAIDALKVRRERDYTDVLVRGLHYPWPAVARRAAEAVAKLERNDLLPQLVGLLEEPDPRAPVMQEVGKKKVPVVRELVRVNHHRNCLLCHAPGNTGQVSPEAVTAAVPVPGEPLPSPSDGYRTSSPDIIVRVDVTYLRQDFSALQPVADANPWPEMQRFDFLVRTRVLTEEEAAAYRDKLTPREPGQFSPYQRAALAALREMTGRDAEPTPEAWRKLLKMPAKGT